jgi:hypothetical protein
MINMDLLPEDQKIIDLLGKLKDTHGAYPSDLLASRRKAYLKQVAGVGLGIGAAAKVKHALNGSNGAGAVTTAASKILEITLLAAITLEAGAIGYLYRGKIVDFFKSLTGSPQVQVVSPPPKSPSVSNPVVVDATPTVAPSETPLVVTLASTPSSPPMDNSSNNTNTNPTSTPSSDSRGNKYGQTPKPSQTKDNKGNNPSGGN